MSRTTTLAAVCLTGALLSGCGSTSTSSGPTRAVVPQGVQPRSGPTTGTDNVEREARRVQRTAGTTAPSWLGRRDLPVQPDGYGKVEPTPPELRDRRFTLPDTVPMLPGTGFASRVEIAPASVIARSTWKPGCPVAASDLAWVRLTFWGFDDARHTGELLVNRSVAGPVVKVFRQLYDDRFPIEEMRITRAAELSIPPTGDGNNTGAFACRPVIGEKVFSQHAYGLAIDVDPFQNPYVKGDLVLPELASSYLDRADVRPGMIEPGGPVVKAFASIGWGWGGSFHRLKDLQHFSRNGT